MTSIKTIAQWVNEGESATLELKKSTAQLDEACHSLCAMVNNNGGRVIFGVTPDSKRLVGQSVSERTLEELAAAFRHFEPPVFPDTEQVILDSSQTLIVVSVKKGTRPCMYKGRAYSRVLNTTAIMPQAVYEARLIESMHSDIRYENEAAVDWQVSMMDTNELIVMMEEAIRRGRLDDPQTREPIAILRGLGLLTKGGQLTKAAVILFGREELLYPSFGQCLLKVARFRGNTRDEFIDNKQFIGNAFSLMRRAEKFIIEYLPIAGKVVPGQMARIDTPLYPIEALREGLANAFCHRDYTLGGGAVYVAIYDDKLEIISSGDLHFQLTPEKLFLPHESTPWNPLIADCFYKRGIVEAWGRGIEKMSHLMRQAELNAPTVSVRPKSVVLTFYPEYYVAPEVSSHYLTERQRLILQALGDHHGQALPLRDIVHLIQKPDEERAIRDDLYFLAKLDLIERQGMTKGARWLLKVKL
jgi:ATP-dependent DNA helicase RecG